MFKYLEIIKRNKYFKYTHFILFILSVSLLINGDLSLKEKDEKKPVSFPRDILVHEDKEDKNGYDFGLSSTTRSLLEERFKKVEQEILVQLPKTREYKLPSRVENRMVNNYKQERPILLGKALDSGRGKGEVKYKTRNRGSKVYERKYRTRDGYNLSGRSKKRKKEKQRNKGNGKEEKTEGVISEGPILASGNPTTSFPIFEEPRYGTGNDSISNSKSDNYYIDPNRANFDKLTFDTDTSSSFINDELLVLFKQPQDSYSLTAEFSNLLSAQVKSIEDLLGDISLSVDNSLNGTMFQVKLNHGANLKAVIDEIRATPGVKAVQPNFILNFYFTPDDPFFNSENSWGQGYQDLWGLKLIGMEKAWDVSLGEDISVAVIDSGIDEKHEDIEENVIIMKSFLEGYDAKDEFGHGTHIAGTIAAIADNGIGIVGVAPKAKIMALKTGGPDLDGDGMAGDVDTSAAIKAITYAVDQGAQVINMSWGGMVSNPLLHEAIKYAYEKNVVLVAAAGNSNADASNFVPACYFETIAVAASNHEDKRCEFSNYGDVIDVAAPGGAEIIGDQKLGRNILSLRADGTDMYKKLDPYDSADCIVKEKYYRARGTSMAAPHVSGLSALLLAEYPSLSNEEIRQIIVSSADDLGEPGKDKYFGYGRINAKHALSGEIPLGLVARIVTPKQGDEVNRYLIVKGCAEGSNFFSYTIELAKDGTEQWQQIVESYNPIHNDILLKQEISEWEPGVYIVRLTVSDSDGNKVYDARKIHIRERPEGGFPFRPKGYLTSGFKVADINNDGEDELIFVSADSYRDYSEINGSYLYLIDSSGIPLPGFPLKLKLKSWATPALEDIDNDGKLEIIWVGESTGYSSGIKILVFNEDGTSPPLWNEPLEYEGVAPGSPVIDDIDNDGIPEIIITYLKKDIAHPEQLLQEIKIIKTDTKEEIYFQPNLKPVYQARFPLLQACTPLVVDIDNDSQKEIMIGDLVDNNANIYLLAGFDISGNVKYKVNVPDGGLAYYSRIVAGDVNSDGEIEFVLVRVLDQFDELYLLSKDGITQGWPKLSSYQFEYFEPLLLNIDGDQDLEIAIKAKDKIYLWHDDGSKKIGWPIIDYSGTLKSISLGGLSIERIIGKAIYNNDGSINSEIGLEGEFIMDQAIGEFDHSNPGPEIVILEVRAGKEMIKIIKDVAGIDDRSISNWPVYKVNSNNNGILNL